MDSDPTRSLADRLEIGDLITRYATAVDRRDWDLYRSVFTTDAEIDYTSAGGIAGTLDEVVAFLDEVRLDAGHRAEGHRDEEFRC